MTTCVTYIAVDWSTHSMANGRFFNLLSIFWLCLAAASLLGHYLADATSMGCEVNVTATCQDEDGTKIFQTAGESGSYATALHAGFNLPPKLSAPLNPVLTLATSVLILPPVAVKPPVLSPPPQ